MFTLVVISPIAKDFQWVTMKSVVCEQLPDHKSISRNVEGEEVPLNYTIKRNAKDIEMIAAATVFYGVKSRFIFDCKRQIAFIDFPRKNLRAFIGREGNIVLKPIIKEKPYDLVRDRGFSKLAALHLEEYLKILTKALSIEFNL